MSALRVLVIVTTIFGQIGVCKPCLPSISGRGLTYRVNLRVDMHSRHSTRGKIESSRLL